MQFYLVAVPAVIILGLSKGGFSGLSSLAMPLLSLVDSPVRAAAIVLPILIVQDWVSVWAFRRDFSLAQPHHPHPRLDDRRRARLAARGPGQRRRGAPRGRGDFDRFRCLHADRATASAALRWRSRASRPGSCGVRSPALRVSSAIPARRRSRST